MENKMGLAPLEILRYGAYRSQYHTNRSTGDVNARVGPRLFNQLGL
ncbi:hypothetical protein ACLKA6_011232 [Drosophila palustris]